MFVLTSEIQDSPTKYEIIQVIAIKISFLRRSSFGHSSITAVMNPSIVQNWLSRPMRSSMKKNRQDQSGAPGSCSTAEGYARKARPGPVKRVSYKKQIARFIIFLFVLNLLLTFI